VKIVLSFIISMMFLIGIVFDANCAEKEKPGASFAFSLTISSPAFAPGATIPKAYTCMGGNYSPALQWEHAPEGAKSFAIIVDDPDAPVGTFTHWIIFNIPAGQTSLAEKASPKGELPEGALEGKNNFGRIGYMGPCPPPGSPHRYFFKLYALDVMLDLPAGEKKDKLTKSMAGHILAEAQIIGMFTK
jgi:Raf kinase inhibitor-like YbhB/YbcL family protein